MMKLKGKEVSDYKNDCRFRDENIDDFKATKLSISISDEYDSEPYISELLADWSREDYIRAVKVADKVKEMLLDINMDMIQYPNDFVSKNGETFLESLKKYKIWYRPDKEMTENIVGSHIRINPETRAFKHMDELRKIIEAEQVELTSENIGVVELGKQTYRELIESGRAIKW